MCFILGHTLFTNRALLRFFFYYSINSSLTSARLWCSLRTRDRPPLQIFTFRGRLQYEGLQAPKNATSYKSHDAPHTHLSWDSPVAFKLHNTSLRHKLYRMYVSNFFLTSHRGRRVNWSSFTTSIVSLLKVQYVFWGDGIIRKEKENIRHDWISRTHLIPLLKTACL